MQSWFPALQVETSTTSSIRLSVLLGILDSGWSMPFPSFRERPWGRTGWVSFTSLTVAISTLDWISGCIYYNLWWKNSFFLADWCGRASSACHTEIFLLPSQTSSSLAQGENLWVRAIPLLHQNLPRLSSAAPRSPHAPVTCWDLHSPQPAHKPVGTALLSPEFNWDPTN